MEFSEISKELIAEGASKKRRRRVESKLNTSIKGCNKQLMVRPQVALGGAVSYMVRSASNPTKMYQVTGRMDGINFKLNCNCGEQFGMEFRDNCKHILATIIFQMKSYVHTHFEDEEKKEMPVKELEMIKMMENLTFL